MPGIRSNDSAEPDRSPSRPGRDVSGSERTGSDRIPAWPGGGATNRDSPGLIGPGWAPMPPLLPCDKHVVVVRPDLCFMLCFFERRRTDYAHSGHDNLALSSNTSRSLGPWPTGEPCNNPVMVSTNPGKTANVQTSGEGAAVSVLMTGWCGGPKAKQYQSSGCQQTRRHVLLPRETDPHGCQSGACRPWTMSGPSCLDGCRSVSVLKRPRQTVRTGGNKEQPE
jgi:hypothetical protein